MSITPVVTGGLVAQRQQELIAQGVLQYFGEKELMAIRLVSLGFRKVAEQYLWNRFTTFSGASSLIPSQMNRESLKNVIIRKLHENAKLRVASDQITSASFVRGLLGPSITLSVNVGSTAPREGMTSLPDMEQISGPFAGKGKAHTKFISGGAGVLMGSPNLTPNALSGDTTESIALIRSQRIKAYFNRYFDLMRVNNVMNTVDGKKFQKMVQAFNSSGGSASLALAPFIEIQPWLMTQLAGADRIVIRMFLISNLDRGWDIIDGLNDMAKKNPHMTIDAYVDEGQVENSFTGYFNDRTGEDRRNFYVRNACFNLMRDAPNVRVFKQTGPKGIMHDKLILAEKDFLYNDGTPGVNRRVILGSSGFSTNVMTNSNWEVMMRVDDNGLYNYMMRHHQASLTSRKISTTSM